MKQSLRKCSATVTLVMLLALLLVHVSSAYSAGSTNQEKALVFLTDVVGLDMTKYNATIVRSLPFSPQLGDEEVHYKLESAESSVEAVCYFKSNALIRCFLYSLKGSPLFAQLSVSVLDTAKGILRRYQTYSKASYIQQMSDMLNTVTELKDMTATSNNVKLKITTEEHAITIQWMYTFNGIDNDYNRVILRFHNGVLYQFSDSWNLYIAGVTDAKVSKEEAIRIAREHVQSYSYKVGDIIVSNFTILDSPISAELRMQPRDDNKLYPWWDIRLYLDKLYPGMVTSLQVTMWADTGEVTHIEAISGGGIPVTENPTAPLTEYPPDTETQPESSSNQQLTTYLIAATVVATIAVATTAVFIKKRSK